MGPKYTRSRDLNLAHVGVTISFPILGVDHVLLLMLFCRCAAAVLL